jgi:uracil-DNA glycosylase
MTIPQPALTREIEAALEWWRAAGVDSDFCDDAICWLSDPVEVAAQSPIPQQPAMASVPSPPPEEPAQTTPINSTDYLGESPPQTIEDFRQWWLDSPAFGAKGLYPRVAPRGAGKAQLMIVVPDPEQSDNERLLSGPQGRLLDNILKAMGLAESDVYIASALPVHTPMADLASLAQSGLEKVLLHHVNLVTPQRLAVFGQGLAPMLGEKLTNRNNPLREINQFTASPPTLVCEGLDSLLELPRLKARFWRRWMQWSATSQSEQ